MGRLLAIARRAKPRAAMELLEAAHVSLAAGVEGDARGAIEGRQVTIVFREDWEAACVALGREVPWTMRRANLLLDGLDRFKRVGARLVVGEVALEVTEENEPCRVMDIQAKGLRMALKPEWRGGVACRVLDGGAIKVGDAADVVA